MFLTPLFNIESDINLSPFCKLGSLHLAQEYEGVFENQNDSLFTITVDRKKNEFFKQIIREANFRQPFYYFQFDPEKNILVYNRECFHRKMYFVIRNSFSNPEVYCNKFYETWSRLKFTQMPPVGIVIADLAILNLLDQGFVVLHSAAVSKGKESSLISALPNTGKTFSSKKLVTGEGYNFLGDDISIVGQGNVYAVPFTGVLNEQVGVYSKLLNTFFRHVGKHREASEMLKNDQVVSHAPLKNIYFLERADESRVERVDKTEAVKKCSLHNRLEFDYLDNPFTTKLFYYLDKSVRELLEREALILQESFADTEVFEIRERNHEDLFDQIFSHQT